MTTTTLQKLSRAPDFDLDGVDGRRHRLDELRGAAGTLVMFLCNHCPYVKAVLDDVIAETRELQSLGVNAVAIMPNDTDAYPEDSFENMKRLAEAKRFPFPYLIDRSQDVARAYGALCTPDFFGFNTELELVYHGRLHAVRHLQRVAGAKRDLFDAMAEIARGGDGPAEQIHSMGCSIKWRR